MEPHSARRRLASRDNEGVGGVKEKEADLVGVCSSRAFYLLDLVACWLVLLFFLGKNQEKDEESEMSATTPTRTPDHAGTASATASGSKGRAPRSSSRPVPDDPHAPEMITRAWPHVREMMSRRGYDTAAMAPTISEAKARKTPLFRLLYPQSQGAIDAALATARAAGVRRARIDRPDGPILVVFTGVPKINVDTVRKVAARMTRPVTTKDSAPSTAPQTTAPSTAGSLSGLPHRALVLSCQGYTTQVPARISESIAPGQHVELATYNQHFFCPVDHWLVPPHDVLSAPQKAALLARLGLADDTLLPRQLRTDAVSRYYGLDPGAVVHYRRPVGTLEMFHYYRVVVNN
ncbi:RNA polymerase Rpb5 [Pandoravirus inopinatum]|uniref:RNA polymerase Rpb5 n=1 Tax=Pandoravirus inopinatum TaxID=1605721 RepID=A0A0B5IYY6_9VIRU|nr:RNA polymerase Rpb5 [Pandoravirus inopinatum]AJF98093.1 RNA polymerase Rpb5 [Pandoravirus inopinatum]